MEEWACGRASERIVEVIVAPTALLEWYLLRKCLLSASSQADWSDPLLHVHFFDLLPYILHLVSLFLIQLLF